MMPVNEEMVERGARAIHARNRKEAWPTGAGGSWDAESATHQISADAKERYRDKARACLTAALSDQVVVPNGWQLLPKEPTTKMFGAFISATLAIDHTQLPAGAFEAFAQDYRAMIAAAPASPAGGT